jgi:hypothetical protein
MTDYPRTNSTCFHGRPSSCKCISTRSAGLGRERGRCIGRRSAIWRLLPGTIQDGRVGQSLNIDLLDGNDPPWLEQISYWCEGCNGVVNKSRKRNLSSRSRDNATKVEKRSNIRVQDCEQMSSSWAGIPTRHRAAEEARSSAFFCQADFFCTDVPRAFHSSVSEAFRRVHFFARTAFFEVPTCELWKPRHSPLERNKM